MIRRFFRLICKPIPLAIICLALGFGGVFAIPQIITQAAPGDCNPAIEFCITSLTPNVGSTEGGASIGSSQATDLNNHEYNSPTYNPNEPIIITHSGAELNPYQPIDYVSFTGTQYINTGINYLTTDDVIKMELDVLNTRVGTLEQLNGLRANLGGSQYWRFFISFYSGSNFNGVYWATAASTSTNVNAVNLGSPVAGQNEVYGMEYSRSAKTNKGYRGGSLIDTITAREPAKNSNGDEVNVGPIFLGAANNGTFGGSSPGYWAQQDVYGFTLTKDGTVVADYKPVWNITTQKYGFYDDVSGDFILSTNGPDFEGPNVDVNGDPLLTEVPIAASVDFKVGGQQVGTCDNITVISGFQISCVPSAWDDTDVSTPEFSQPVDIDVTIGSDSATAAGAYTYRAPMSATSLTPPLGPVTGGQTITIDGTNFLPHEFTSDYVLVEYAEFKGTASSPQYINTGINYLTTDNYIKMEVDASYARVGGGGSLEQLTGFRSNSSGTWRFFISEYLNSLYVTSNVTTTNGINLGSVLSNERVKVALDYNRSTTSFGGYRNESAVGARKTATGPTFDAGPLYLGATRDGSSFAYSSNYKVYGFTVEKDGVTVANYIPMKSTLTGLCGFWDTISLSFKTNDGTGNLTCGGQVGIPVQGLNVIINDINSPLCYITDINNTEIYCVPPAGTVGLKDVVIKSANETITMEDAYTYAPVVTSVNTPFPSGGGYSNVGPTTGGNTITVRGYGFQDAQPTLLVMVGDVSCTNINIKSQDELTCDMPNQNPEHAGGPVDVSVIIDGIPSIPTPNSTADDYIFRAPMKITKIEPDQGSIDGNAEVTITGINFMPPSGIPTTGKTVIFDIDGTPVPCATNSWTNTQIKCTTGAHDKGFVDVTITNAFESATEIGGYNYITISISLDSYTTDINISIPGTEAFGSNEYIVKTNAERGYELTIQADKIITTGIIENPDVKVADDETASCLATGAKFSPIATDGALTNNKWGWKTSNATPTTGDTDWKPMTSAAQEIARKNSPTAIPNGDSYNVYFGAKSDYTQPACTYKVNLYVTATVAP